MGRTYFDKKPTPTPLQGSPHLYVWGAMVSSCLDSASHVLASTQNRLRQNAEQAVEAIFLCRIGKGFALVTSNISLSTSPILNDVVSALLRLSLQLGFKVMHGTPPKGPAERAVEQALHRIGGPTPNAMLT
eukprot:13474413-Heterocapsa_arctica.AAC.1